MAHTSCVMMFPLQNSMYIRWFTSNQSRSFPSHAAFARCLASENDDAAFSTTKSFARPANSHSGQMQVEFSSHSWS